MKELFTLESLIFGLWLDGDVFPVDVGKVEITHDNDVMVQWSFSVLFKM